MLPVFFTKKTNANDDVSIRASLREKKINWF